jgi:hypothetical protein
MVATSPKRATVGERVSKDQSVLSPRFSLLILGPRGKLSGRLKRAAHARISGSKLAHVSRDGCAGASLQDYLEPLDSLGGRQLNLLVATAEPVVGRSLGRQPDPTLPRGKILAPLCASRF